MVRANTRADGRGQVHGPAGRLGVASYARDVVQLPSPQTSEVTSPSRVRHVDGLDGGANGRGDMVREGSEHAGSFGDEQGLSVQAGKPAGDIRCVEFVAKSHELFGAGHIQVCHLLAVDDQRSGGSIGALPQQLACLARERGGVGEDEGAWMAIHDKSRIGLSIWMEVEAHVCRVALVVTDAADLHAVGEAGLVYKYRICDISSSGIGILINEKSSVLKHLRVGDILDMKFREAESSGFLKDLKTEIRHITRINDDPYGKKYLIGFAAA